MKVYDIVNTRVIEILEEFRYNFFEKYTDRSCNRCYDENKGDMDYYTGDEYRDSVVRQGTDHPGAATTSYSFALKPGQYWGKDKLQYTYDFDRLNNAITTELGLERTVLSQVYPPGGFIEWHSNADAPGHNLIFTYSENGDGDFTYIDPVSKKQITLRDKPGWNLKAGYFGTYDEGLQVYHCAKTNCWRMTLSFIVGFNVDYWKDALDHIQSQH